MTYEDAVEKKYNIEDSYYDEGKLHIFFVLPSLRSEKPKYIALLRGIMNNTPPDVRNYCSNDDYVVEGVGYDFVYTKKNK